MMEHLDTQITQYDRHKVQQEAVEARLQLRLRLKRQSLATMVSSPMVDPKRMFPNHHATFGQRSKSIVEPTTY